MESLPLEQDIDISELDRAEIITKVVELTRKNYCIPQAGEKAALELEHLQSSGEFTTATTLKAFANKLTSVLRKTDIHFSIRLKSEAVPEPPTYDNSGSYKLSDDEIKIITEQLAFENHGIKTAEILIGRVGYLKWDKIMDAEIPGVIDHVVDSLNYLSDCFALIVDLRDCGGGHGETADVLYDALFQLETHVNDFYFRPQNETTKRFVGKSDRFPGLKRKWFGKPVFILTSKKTFSCGEEIAYTLQTFGKAKTIGSRTGAGAHPGQLFWIHPHMWLFISTGINYNTITKTDWEPNGVEPDIPIQDPDHALLVGHKLALEYVVAEKLKTSSEEYIGKVRFEYEKKIEELEIEIQQALQSKQSKWVKTVTTKKTNAKKIVDGFENQVTSTVIKTIYTST
ncbi:hypothetical protein HK100_012020 [Physocladia obscura]|uniref:Tail specific protease domain-containing protein n=1 Tax=Physocladia obscura TaxID=109957 RepID=A0AAD5T233_9FUNG|nr:hypothetical protein HK100_012020 [Physocladia obscura]